MASLLRDPVIRRIPWRDLATLRPIERWRELLLPLPFLLLARLGAHFGLTALFLLGSAYFFLAGLRLVHDAFHANIGVPRRANHAVLVILSGLMLGSMHAVRLTHLEHHRDCLGPQDVEGATARRSGLGALGQGFAFPVALHRAAWHLASPGNRRWIILELTLTAVLIALALAGIVPGLAGHVALMLLAQALTGFFAVWTVHHDVHAERQVARTLRSRMKSALALGMFFHLEHHLFPRVPTCHLPALADRLERTAPGLSKAAVY